ncbi:hypothetical protein TNCV_645251 [Trichonephila clavipes]|nr:hypothetical protein TNCV_645251 [Trichonephila clavipes]
MQLPDRKESMKQLEEIQGEIDILKFEKDVLSNKLEEQQKHMSLLLTSAIEMKNKLKVSELDEIFNVIEEVVNLVRHINLVVYSDNVQELLYFHSEEQTIDELIEMHEQQQGIEELES